VTNECLLLILHFVGLLYNQPVARNMDDVELISLHFSQFAIHIFTYNSELRKSQESK